MHIEKILLLFVALNEIELIRYIRQQQWEA